ncbi:MAG: hypothetical protein ABI905_10265 [Betaproteobacteria bacterium]
MTPFAFLRLFVPRLAVVVGALALLEWAFRLGVWEPLVRPESNAGQSVQLKMAVNALGADKLDFITLGDSRAVYGIEHQRVADAATSAGFRHVNLSLAGTHWLTIDALLEWITVRNRNLKGVLIATNVNSFTFEGNGSYELAMAAPFMASWNSERMNRSVAFNRADVSTYGVYSALFLAREDVQDLITHPRARLREIRAYAGRGSAPLTFSVKVAGDSCAIAHSSMAECAAATPATDTERSIVSQCKSELPASTQRADWRKWTTPGAMPHLEQLALSRQAELRAMPLPKPLLVVLMPVPALRRDELTPQGLEEFTKAALKPLVDDGTIVLYDFTHFFDKTPGGECVAFWDLYHQNTVGQARLTDALLPTVQHELYNRAGKAGTPPAAR